jgi:adenylate cyclase
LRLGGEICAITILVADLRGFTSMSANLSPHDVIDILNQYLGGMVDVLTKYHGTVDEFLGDGILAFFGAPLAAEDDHQRAIACAIEMQCALTGINVEQRRRGLPELRMGIGISSGEVIVGNIGSEKRMKYGAVGSTINEAYRIESCTIGGQILISPTVYEHVRDLVQVQSVQAVQFKGFKEPVTLYDIVGIQGKYACTLPEGTPETFVALATPLPIVCFPIEAQTVSEHAMPGTITHLAETSAEGLLHGEVVLHSNLKLHFNPQEAPELSEVYAKVIRRDASCEAPGAMHICIGFTSLPEDVKMFLVEQRAAVRQTAG